MGGRTPRYRQWEYEQFIKLMAIEQAIVGAPDCTEKELQAIRDAFDDITDADRPEHYKRFSKKVFALEFQKNPYLFLEEFLTMIKAMGVGDSVVSPQ